MLLCPQHPEGGKKVYYVKIDVKEIITKAGNVLQERKLKYNQNYFF